ncbi:vitamin K-dependent protein S-like isoform X2 [Branchiostoma floridae]|uniref:Vitamin K-dependent protein S-like isoform X2 n=1 Tax=Branchiostoma floridae TaxID=7739 RepID=A0A9J7HKW7_BRAFL|nr:vitamin K-dependent protein S-like isoform X2 [Branchiostoma floridae]
MSAEKLPMDSDGYFSRRRVHGPVVFTSLVQLLTACMSVIIIVLVIQEGARLSERVALQGREIEELSALKSGVADYNKEVAAMRAQREVEVTYLRERLQALEDKIQNGVPTEGQTNHQSVPGKNSGPRAKRQAVTSETGVCLQGPPGIPGRDGRDGMPGRDCPCGSKDVTVDECTSNNGGCAHTCTSSLICSCRDGFVLNEDGLSCDDVDECASNNGGCAQTCTNTPGSFFCTCPNYVSNASGLACGALPSCKAYITAGRDYGDGWYIVQPDPNSEQFSVYCDQTTLGGGWMRFYYKAGPNTCHNYQGVTWTEDIMSKVNATDFLVSDDITTGNTDQSWLFSGFEFGSSACPNYKSCVTLESVFGINTIQAVANLGNCRTPSGSNTDNVRVMWMR